nr:hypothetical protein [Mesorhizobium sp.]
MGDDLSKPDFDARFYRFSVRCDREFNQQLEKAARRARVSVTTLVQRHFETILGVQVDDAGFDADAFARQHAVTSTAARLFNALRLRADADGTVTGSVEDFAALSGLPGGRLSYHFQLLFKADLVDTVVASRAGRKGTYRILNHERITP